MTNISDDPTIAYTEGRMQGKADVLNDLANYDPGEHNLTDPVCCDVCQSYRKLVYELAERWPLAWPWGMQGQSVTGGTEHEQH
jgi:hypothetical protein